MLFKYNLKKMWENIKVCKIDLCWFLQLFFNLFEKIYEKHKLDQTSMSVCHLLDIEHAF